LGLVEEVEDSESLVVEAVEEVVESRQVAGVEALEEVQEELPHQSLC